MDPPPGGDQPVEPEPGSYSGGFAGPATIVVNHPYLPNLPPTVVHSRDLKTDLAEALSLTVQPDYQTFTLFYVIPDHRARFKADVVFLSDPSIQVDFGLAIQLTYATGGRPAPDATGAGPVAVHDPVWLASAELRLMHPEVTVNKKVDVKIAEAFTGSVAGSVERAMSGRTDDIAALSRTLTGGLGGALADVEQQGLDLSLITPWYDEGSHELWLRVGHPGMVVRDDPAAELGR